MGSRAHNFCEFSLVGRSEILRRWRRSYSKLGMVEDFRCHRRVSCAHAHARSNPCLVIWTYIRLWDFADVPCYLLYYPPHSHSSSLSFCPIHIPPTNKLPFNQTISPSISLYLSTITSHHLTRPNLSITRPNRSSAELVPEVVSPRSESNSWTTLTDPSSETSRAPCESMTFWRFWSLSERLGEFFFSVFPSSYLPLISSRVVSVGGCLGGEVEGWWLVNDKVLHNIMREMTRRGEMDD